MNIKKNLKNKLFLLLFVSSQLTIQSLCAMATDTVTGKSFVCLNPKIELKVQSFGDPESPFYGCVSYTQGNRNYMEDVFCLESNLFGSTEDIFYGIFDGHGGIGVANYLKENLLKNILNPFYDGITEKIIKGFLQTNDDILKIKNFCNQGSTAICAFIFGSQLIIANAGDCRAVLCKNGKAIQLSKDHKASDPDEIVRVEKTGAKVVNWGGLCRVNATLAISRCFGDDCIGNRKAIEPMPDIQAITLSPEDEFLILASDGLWDALNNQQAVNIIQETEELSKAASRLVLTAFQQKKPISDNITVIIIDLKHIPKKTI